MSRLQSNDIGTNLIPQYESSPSGVRGQNYLFQTCSLFPSEIVLDVGAIISDEKWHQNACRELIEEKALLS